MKKEYVRYYPVTKDNTNHGITHLRCNLQHTLNRIQNGFYLSIVPVKRENEFESMCFSLRMGLPSICVLPQLYSAKRYETLKSEIDSLILSALKNWKDNPYEYDLSTYEEREI